MPEEIRRKGKHLTWEERQVIQRGLREHRTFTEIAIIIGCSADTISKEIRNHRYHKPHDNKWCIPNRCKYRDTCRKRNICNKKGRYKCKIPCRECTSCNKRCQDFVDFPCQIEKKPPYVCNACPKSRSCLFDKYLYNASYADREYREKLSEARRGIDMTKDELIALDELVSPLIRKGQPLSHILEEHRGEIPVSERTLYYYIGKGYMTVKNIDMRRTVRYKKRKHEEKVKVSPIQKIRHHYKDYLKELEENPGIRVVEMDTVIGIKGGKVLHTVFWQKEKLMLARLLDNKGMDGTVKTFDELEEKLGKEKFRELFPVVLTDNGTEFANPDLFEYSKDGSCRMKLFYCDPRHSEQKGELEKNHEYIRYILPQGSSFDDLTQEKIDIMMSHINSTTRPSLQGKSPIQLALQHFGKDTVEKLGLTFIKADDVCLKPELLK
ncbi:MAG: IS30 family transposase [Eubacterium sp.]|nr:IS30 family transposase [Eubacterium sp.]